VHFNAYVETDKPMGCEVLYVTQSALASELSAAIAENGLINRGGKKRTDLFFLNHTAEKAVLLEVAFVDSQADADIDRRQFNSICESIAEVLSGEEIEDEDGEEIIPPTPDVLFRAIGTCSYFGGPNDTGVSASEGLAFHYEINEANQHLFLPLQPKNTTGLARRLNAKAVMYVACRWDYSVTPKTMLAGPNVALVRATRTGRELTAFPADWGPHEEKTGRAADLSPALMDALDIVTDDEVEVIYPYLED
jgi:N-acetylmuramoyl-L-alanine amidase